MRGRILTLTLSGVPEDLRRDPLHLILYSAGRRSGVEVEQHMLDAGFGVATNQVIDGVHRPSDQGHFRIRLVSEFGAGMEDYRARLAFRPGAQLCDTGGDLVRPDLDRLPTVPFGRGATDCRVAQPPYRERGPALLRRLRLKRALLKTDPLTLKGRLLLAPQHAHHINPLIHHAAALAEVGAQIAVLVLHPAYADPKNQAAIGVLIDRGRLLGRQNRIALRQNQYGRAQRDRLGDGSHIA